MNAKRPSISFRAPDPEDRTTVDPSPWHFSAVEGSARPEPPARVWNPTSSTLRMIAPPAQTTTRASTTLRMIPLAPPPRTIPSASPSVPALTHDVEPKEEIEVGRMPRFRQGTVPWAAVGAAAMVVGILASMALTGGEPPGFKNKSPSSASSPPLDSMELPPPATAAVPPGPEPIAPPPPTTSTSPVPPPTGQQRPYSPERDPAVQFNAPEEWLGHGKR